MSTGTFIADYFKESYPMAQLKREMFNKDDIYKRIPELVFRFKENTTLDAYEDLKKCIELFSGNLKWTIFAGFYGKKKVNYSLVPQEVYQMHKKLFENDEVILPKEYFSPETYKKLCEEAVADIPELYEFIKNNFVWKKEYEEVEE